MPSLPKGEAGGHRGTFDISEHPMGAQIGTFALVPQIVDHVKIPLLPPEA